MHNVNVSLLAKTQEQILAQAVRFNMEDFDSDIAGFTIAAAGMELGMSDAFAEARKALGISTAKMNMLCHLQLWPRQFRVRFNPEPTSRRQLRLNAQIAAERIGHFVRTGC
jgi:hypothetical protein